MPRIPTNIDYARRVNEVTRYIDRHHSEKITIARLSTIANLSTFHFCRIFQSCTGETLGEFLQRYRLHLAYKKIKANKGSDILSIALDVGYENHSSFTRAFRKYFGVSPTDILRNDPPAPRNKLQRKSKKADLDNLIPDFAQFPEFACYGMQVSGYSQRSFIQSAKPAFEKLEKILTHSHIERHETQTVGIPLDNPQLTEHAHCRFIAAIKSPFDLSRFALMPYQFEHGLWAIFDHVGSYTTLWQTWHKIYERWVVKNGIALRHAPPFEVYVTPPKVPDPEKITKIHIPIFEHSV